MQYPLPVIQNSTSLTQEWYDSSMNDLIAIGERESICDIDEAGNCFVGRTRGGGSCCTRYSYHACNHLGETGCTTKNILCKTYYCDEAFKKLSLASQNRVNEVKSAIVDVYRTRQHNPNEQVNNLYFKNEEEVKTMLKINTSEIPFDEFNLLKN